MGSISLAERARNLKITFILQMSSYYKPSGYTDYQKTTQWLNNCVSSHDLFCWCNDPWKHLMQGLLERGSEFDLSEKDKRLLQKCLITGKKDGGNQEERETTTTTKEETGLDLEEGELEKLFAEENDDTG